MPVDFFFLFFFYRQVNTNKKTKIEKKERKKEKSRFFNPCRDSIFKKGTTTKNNNNKLTCVCFENEIQSGEHLWSKDLFCKVIFHAFNIIVLHGTQFAANEILDYIRTHILF